MKESLARIESAIPESDRRLRAEVDGAIEGLCDKLLKCGSDLRYPGWKDAVCCCST